MESLLEEFARNPGLGIGGALISEKVGSRVRRQITNMMHVSGTCQMFRRRCFEAIGGYLPLKHGGEDTAADVMARMRGWEATTFLHLEIRHGRRCGTAMGGLLQARYRDGVLDYTLGKPPLFMAVKTVRRLVEDPLVLGSFARLAGLSAPGPGPRNGSSPRSSYGSSARRSCAGYSRSMGGCLEGSAHDAPAT